MYIGNLIKNANRYLFKRGTRLPLLPDLEGKELGWGWLTMMDMGVDIIYTLEQTSFVGAVTVVLAEGSAVYKAEVFCDGKCAGEYHAETGKNVTGTFDVSVGAYAKEVLVRFYTVVGDFVIDNIEVIGAVKEKQFVFPTPETVSFGEKAVKLSDIRGVVGNMDNADITFACNHLEERIKENYGEQCFGANGTLDICFALCEQMAAESYQLMVSEDGIQIKASDKRGLLYAAEALVQLMKDGEIPACNIEDRPYREMRGFHFGLPPREEIEFTKRVIKYVLLPMRYNTLFIEFAGGMRFDSHPEISEAWLQANSDAEKGLQPPVPHSTMCSGGGLLEKEEVRDLVDFAKAYGFEIIPEIQSLSHVQYITYAHPDIAEFDYEEAKELDAATYEEGADPLPPDMYNPCYCPSNEKSYEIIFDLAEEIIEVTQPERYVSIGHDEVWKIGLCPKCKQKSNAELFAYHVNRFYDWLKERGYKTAMWGDMVQTIPTRKRFKMEEAIHMLPKDILMLDFIWYFVMDMEPEDVLLEAGYKVAVGNLYSSHFPRYEKRMAKENMIGGQISTWDRMDEHTIGILGKFFDTMYTAEMLWNSSYDERARRLYTNKIAEMMPTIRDEIRGTKVKATQKMQYQPIALAKALSQDKVALTQGKVLLPNKLEAAISAYQGTDFDVSDVAVLSDNPMTVSINETYDRVAFLHTTLNNERRVAWKPLEVIGQYKVTYADGTSVELPIEYAGNINVYTRYYAQPMPGSHYRHQGYTGTYFADPVIEAKAEDGSNICMMSYTWTNPYPEKKIVSIDCVGCKDTDAKIVLAGISGVNITAK